MIKQFELGKDSKALVSELAKSKNTAEEYCWGYLGYLSGCGCASEE